MVKINLLKKDAAVEEELPSVDEISVDSPEPEKKDKPKKSGKKGGSLKYILILLVVIAIGGSGYLAYIQGWFLGSDETSSVETMVIADETPMDTPKDSKPAEKITQKPPPQKTAAVDNKTKQVQTKPKSDKPAMRSQNRATQKMGSGISQVVEGRILLDVFNSIASSVSDDMGDMKLTVSKSGVTLAIGLNSREDAALLLRKIRQKWPMSNLRAVRFERSKSTNEYAYSTQFSGSVTFKGIVPSSGAKKRGVLHAEPFKKKISQLATAHGLKLLKNSASSEVKMRGRSTVPITITAEGSKESIRKFIDSLAKLDVAYGLSRASILSKDSASSTVSLYINLLKSNSKALS